MKKIAERASGAVASRIAAPRRRPNGGRTATVTRATKETTVEVTLAVDGSGRYDVQTGVPFLNHMLELFTRHGFFDLTIRASGDVEVDDHHTVEDVGLTLGQAFHQALGGKEGIRRFGEATVPLDEALTNVVVDVSGRPFLAYDLKTKQARVGTFDVCMENLRRHDLVSPVKDFIASGRPFLGICLGMQLLFDESEEFGPVRGLGVLPGRVVRFPDDPAGLRKVPHMGWNALQILRRAPHLDGLDDGTQVYFVHSYYPVPEDPRVIATTTNYGGDFVSSVWLANVFACQFHPEKSQAAGLRILANFAALTGEVETRVGAAG